MKTKYKIFAFAALLAATACEKQIEPPVGTCTDTARIQALVKLSDNDLVSAADQKYGRKAAACQVDTSGPFYGDGPYKVYVAGILAFKSDYPTAVAAKIRAYLQECRCGI